MPDDSKRPDSELDVWIAATIQRALAYAVTLVGNRAEAEDLVHDCYGRLLAKADRYDLPRDGEKLLFKAITNACINAVQRKHPEVGLDAAESGNRAGKLPLADRADEQPDQRAMHRELEAAVGEALAELPVTQRAVVELRSLGHSLVEVAEMLEISQVNARVLLHRARQVLEVQLRPFLKEHVK